WLLPSSLSAFASSSSSSSHSDHRYLPSFPTRRSSDLISIVDYLCLYQAVWSPPFLSLAVFGGFVVGNGHPAWSDARQGFFAQARSEEHTSELQSRENLVCRLLLEKKKRGRPTPPPAPA